MQMHRLIILCFLLTSTAAAANDDPNHISINCGRAAPTTSLTGRWWSGDAVPEGSSTVSTVKGDLIAAIDAVPYRTARVSRSRFSYSFQIRPGQKFIRLHFNPVSYHGFQSFNDFFTVEAGPFTLLANFSASITARALSVNVLAKDFCIIVQGNQPLNIVFSPETSRSKYNYAFINGIEIISVPSTISYCHGGDNGIHVLGQKSVIYVDNSTVLERVYHRNMKWGSVLDDIGGMFGMWEDANKASDLSWRVYVDVGFRYLVRIHLSEVGLKMDFTILIDNMIALTSADVLQKGGNQSILWYNYMVMVEGHKREGKRRISISLKSEHEILDRHGPLEGFEVFKLSNHHRSLASPNPLPPRGDSPSRTIQTLLYSLLGHRNATATVVFTVICLVNIIVHLLNNMWVADKSDIAEEENKPSARAKRPCRRFSLAEIQSATRNFHDGFVIGKGGFGKVYKGLIDDGREVVAIKRSKPDSKQGEFQFWTEVEMLSELRHVNLVPLIGYCIEQREMMIVYEYMPYGSLADHLYKLSNTSNYFYPLSWKQRLNICIGASRALDYLHTGHGVIHRDVKSSNILLDEKLVAKVSDFGLAKTGTCGDSQSQESTNLKGTVGYIDPDFFRTHKLTKKSDTYSFGVVLLEVLCGRPAVDKLNEEDKRSLSTWALDNISKGQVDHIVAPSLRRKISADSLNTFVKVAERCLHAEPKKRPAMRHIVINLEFALLQQEKAESLDPKVLTSVEAVFSSIHESQKENMDLLVQNEKMNVADPLPGEENVRPSAHNEIRNVTDAMPCTDNDSNILSAAFNVQTDTTLPGERSNSRMIDSDKNNGRKSIITKNLAMGCILEDEETSTGPDALYFQPSAPLARRTSNIKSEGSPIFNERTDVMSSSSTPTLRIFSFEELKASTSNFRSDLVIGEGGFGRVYKGWIYEKSSAREASGSIVAVKMLDPESRQGYREWQSEMILLARLSHPNLVKLLGYGSGQNKRVLFLVYEFMQNGNLDNQLFGRSLQPLPWDIRLKILIGAAHGLAFLHSSETNVIHRDFKPSNILLDELYHAKISDFGLAREDPPHLTHVSTEVFGTFGYASPEYLATGHLTAKNDVYGFGVVLLEVLTGLRVLDKNCPSGQRNLVDWMKPRLSDRMELNKLIDPLMEGRYSPSSAAQLAKLALNCLEVDPKRRSTMQQVVETLESMDTSPEKPRQPRVHFITQVAEKPV